MNYKFHKSDSPEHARVTQTHPLMFPRSAREICRVIGLPWRAALKLRADGWLSFDPRQPGTLDEAHEVELRFLGHLVVAGCGRALLAELLIGLCKPYQYRCEWLYYDWSARVWRLLPRKAPLEPDTEDDFVGWVQELIARRDTLQLEMIADDAIRALQRITRSRRMVGTPLPFPGQDFPTPN